MYGGKTVAVVVPAYNEEQFVGDVIETVPAFVDRVYVVDDCSTDDTWTEILQTLADLSDAAATDDARSAENEEVAMMDGNGGFIEVVDGSSERPESGSQSIERRITAIRHETNTGVGGAIKTGYRRALADGIDVTAIMGGDGQMDPAILDRIIDPVVFDEADYSKGNRLRYMEYRREMSGWRTFGNFLLTYLTRIASGYWRMMDPQNGYTAISREALETIDIETIYEDYGFCNHLLVRLNSHDLRIADVPMRAVYGDESSHIQYSQFVPSLSLLLLRSYLHRLLRKNIRNGSRPRPVFQLLGVVLLVGGTGLSVGSLLAGATAGAVGGGLSLLTGAGLFATGMVAERRRNEDLEIRIDPAAPPWDASSEADVPTPSEDAPQGGS